MHGLTFSLLRPPTSGRALFNPVPATSEMTCFSQRPQAASSAEGGEATRKELSCDYKPTFQLNTSRAEASPLDAKPLRPDALLPRPAPPPQAPPSVSNRTAEMAPEATLLLLLPKPVLHLLRKKELLATLRTTNAAPASLPGFPGVVAARERSTSRRWQANMTHPALQALLLPQLLLLLLRLRASLRSRFMARRRRRHVNDAFKQSTQAVLAS